MIQAIWLTENADSKRDLEIIASLLTRGQPHRPRSVRHSANLQKKYPVYYSIIKDDKQKTLNSRSFTF